MSYIVYPEGAGFQQFSIGATHCGTKSPDGVFTCNRAPGAAHLHAYMDGGEEYAEWYDGDAELHLYHSNKTPPPHVTTKCGRGAPGTVFYCRPCPKWPMYEQKNGAGAPAPAGRSPSAKKVGDFRVYPNGRKWADATWNGIEPARPGDECGALSPCGTVKCGCNKGHLSRNDYHLFFYDENGEKWFGAAWREGSTYHPVAYNSRGGADSSLPKTIKGAPKKAEKPGFAPCSKPGAYSSAIEEYDLLPDSSGLDDRKLPYRAEDGNLYWPDGRRF